MSSFTANVISGCKPLNVQFTNSSVNATAYSWDFGNGSTSTQNSPANLFTNTGVFTVTLTATGPGGSSSSTATVTVVNPPVANFTANQTTVCQNSGIISFINNSSSYDSCVWDFGDGVTSSVMNPVHAYNLPGLFSVSLIVYDRQHNCNSGLTRNQYINVLPKPVIVITSNDSTTCDQNHVFTFATNGSGISQWLWDFGDGNQSASSNPSHVYADSGYQNVMLIATSSFGCKDTVVNYNFINVRFNPVPVITPTVTKGCAPFPCTLSSSTGNILNCLWDFGDGFSDSSKTALHYYKTGGAFVVLLKVTYNNGCTNQNSYTAITSDSTPTFSFSATNSTGCAPLAVQFNNSNSAVNYKWLWTFGDGDTSTAYAPVHIYTSNGAYTVGVSATNLNGCTFNYRVYPNVNVLAPKSLFTADKTSGCFPLTVNFNNQSQNASQYIWDFGDGNTSTGFSPSHTYLQAGSYSVNLIAKNSSGCTDSLIYSQPINVSQSGNTFATLPPVIACAPFTVYFQDNSVSSAWLWNFGDGATSVIANPSHTYTQPGSYTVSLSTQGANGNCSQNITDLRHIIINGGVAEFTHTESTCPPYQASLTDSSTNASSWLWSFDDGATSTLQNPSHIFAVPGFHSVSLTITTPEGCKATEIKNYELYFEPLTAKVTTFVSDTTLPMSVQFFAHSMGATHWSWNFGDGGTSLLENPVHIYSSAGPYILSLTIWNDSCSRIYTYPPVTFGGGSGSPGGTPIGTTPSAPIYNCAPYEMNFKNPFTDAISWLWEFGDGQSSTASDPTHLYTAGGDYQIKLYIQTATGITDSVIYPELIHIDKFDADFTISSTNNCSGVAVTLLPSDTTAACKWDMGNSSFLTNTISHYVYNTTNTNYLITLVATDTNGCVASASQTFYASETNPLTVSASRVCAGDTLFFSNGGLNYSNYSWDFGDSTYSTLANPFHVYSDSGNFQVKFIVSDGTGCTKNFLLSQQIQVLNPKAIFTIPDIRSNCVSIKAEVVSQSTGADYLDWDFGNGQYSTQSQASVLYYTPGTYYIKLTASNSICSSTYISTIPVIVPDLVADFQYIQTQYCTPIAQAFTDLSKDAVSWNWSFGDGLNDTLQNPVHIYNQAPGSAIILTVKDYYGCIKTISKPNVNITNANFGMNITSGCVPLTVNFSDSSSNAISWNWDFGDGNHSNQQSPLHQYATKGVYSVHLIVESTFGCYDTLVKDSVINSGSITAKFSADTTSGCAPLIIALNDLSSNASSWLWDFGDGSYSSKQNPSHIYNAPGTYFIQLTATDSLGCADSVMMTAPVMIYGSQPLFTIAQHESCVPMTLNITNQSINDVAWEWNFGNGVTDTTKNPTYTYDVPGAYMVTLQTKDNSGCISTYSYPFTIYARPQARAAFTIADSTGCTPFTLNARNQSVNADSLLWSFGDGNFSNDSNPAYIYNQGGIYIVKLYAITNYGCNDSMQYPSPVVVNIMPHAGFYVDDSIGCMPVGIQFNNTSEFLDMPVFNWLINNTDTTSVVNPLINFTVAGTYDVKLTVTNNGGCSDVVSIPGLITIYDPLPPPPVQLYSLSVIDTGTIAVKWRKSNLNDIDYYALYRLNPITGNYDSVTVVYNNNTTMVNIMELDDNANTNLRPYSYKILATDKCGSKVGVTALTAHTSIFVTGANKGANISINWTPYSGCSNFGYNIYRSDDNGISFTYLSETDSAVHTFLDTTAYCPFIYQYKVMAKAICGEVAALSISNVVKVDHTSFTWQQTNSVTRATVVDNKYILLEWLPVDVMPQTVTGYDIFRSVDNVNFQVYKKVKASPYYFEDHSVDVQHRNYYYKVAAINYCDLISVSGYAGSSILLKGDYDANGHSLLKWTPYKEWSDGVDHYMLEKINKDGIWEMVKTTDPDTTETKDE